jgi:riboflavin synthase
MFTGIITNLGEITEYKKIDDELELVISSDIDKGKLYIGQSIACDGICLTVTKLQEAKFTVFLSNETLQQTIVGNWQKGRILNLELAARLDSYLDGHLVSGHVENRAKIIEIKKLDNCYQIELEISEQSLPYVIHKGSVTINGVALTINELKAKTIMLNIIPHSWEVTNFKHLERGDEVNFEPDMIAKYVERLMEFKK